MKIKRAVISVVIFAVIYILSGYTGYIIDWRWASYDARAIVFLAAVIGAGCYWIGSNER